MDIIVENRTTYFYVEPQGRIDTLTAPLLEQSLQDDLTNGAVYVIDFKSVPYISSAGMRVIMVAAKKSSVAKGKLLLCGMNSVVKNIFELSGFDKILNICEDFAGAEKVLAE